MEFVIRNIVVLDVGGMYIAITESMVNTWIIMAVLIAFAIVVRVSLKNFKDKPTGFQNIVEFLVEIFNNYVIGTAGKQLAFLSPWFFTVFLFVALSNISGLFFLRPPTADWTVTFPLAFATFFLIHCMAIKFQPKEHLKGFLEPIFIFLPINILGELAKPISLSFRLFGNILGGVILLSVIYELAPLILRLPLPIVLHAYFDLAMGLLHAYVFVTLSLAYIGVAAGASND